MTATPYEAERRLIGVTQKRRRGRLRKGEMDTAELEQMARQARDGDKEAFVAMMEACKPALLRAAGAILKSEEDAADAMQETVLKAFQGIQGLKKPAHAKTWLTRILINNCYEILRQKKTVPLEEFLPEEAREYEWDSSLDVRNALGGLNAGDQLLLTLFYVEDMSQKQIGEVLGISENAVKQRLARAKRHFKSIYERGAAVNE